MQTALAHVTLAALLTCRLGEAGEPSAPRVIDEAGRIAHVAARHFGKRLETALNELDGERLSKMVDNSALFDRAIMHRRFGAAFQSGLEKGFHGEKKDRNPLVEALLEAMADGSECQLLGVRDRPHGPCPLFRLLGESGLLYHECMLAVRDDRLVVIDFYAYNAGNYFSGMLGELWEILAAESDPAYIKLRPGGRAQDNRSELFMQMVAANKAKDHNGVLNNYRQLPPILQNNTSILLMVAGAASQIDDDSYMAGLEEIAKRRPHDAMLKMMLLDLYFVDGRYDEMLKIVDRADKLVGGDPFLDSFRILALVRSGDHDNALTIAQKARRTAPNEEWPVTSLYEVHIARRDFRGATLALDRLERDFDWYFDSDSHSLEDFDEQFATSPEGRRWLARHGIE